VLEWRRERGGKRGAGVCGLVWCVVETLFCLCGGGKCEGEFVLYGIFDDVIGGFSACSDAKA
jgi:hypothetical protein